MAVSSFECLLKDLPHRKSESCRSLDLLAGLRVAGSSLESVAQGLDKLLFNGEKAEEMGCRGWSRAQAEFAWERVAEKTRALSRKMTRSDTT